MRLTQVCRTVSAGKTASEFLKNDIAFAPPVLL